MDSFTSDDGPSPEEAVAKAIYEDTVASLCIEIACGMHRMAKTGVLPLSSIMAPSASDRDFDESSATEDGGGIDMRERGRSSSFAPSEDEITNVDGPETKKARLGAPDQVTKPTLDQGSNDGGQAENCNESDAPGGGGESADRASVASPAPVTRSSTGVDIWGAIPPKEPRSTARCGICGRHVSALRFAPHLDKCMGIGGSRGFGRSALK